MLIALAIAGVADRSVADDQTPADRADGVAADSPAGVEFFERKIRPVLVERCHKCHSSGSQKLQAGLLLDSREAILKGGDSGAAVTPGNVEESLLVQAVRHDGLKMPPDGLLPGHVVADIERWVRLGAPWPKESGPGAQVLQKRQIDVAAGRSFWAFQPVVERPVPATAHATWPRTKVDHFVLRALEQHGMRPSPAADKRTLVRRLYYDLVGLPPSSEEVAAFIADESADAYERLVERLLASPLYGERWARRWLDVVRYGEDHPDGFLPPRNAWKYRDWVIRALNDDLPYDEFVRRQLAADQIAGLPRPELAALGYLGLSPQYAKEEKRTKEVTATILADEWEERIDLVTRSLLGLTVACARCHDHKFDPVTSADYYSLAGVLASTQLVERPTVAMFEEDSLNIARMTEDLREHQQREKSRRTQREGLKKSKEPDIYRYDKEILESASEIQRITSLLPPDFDRIPRVDAVHDAAQRINDEFFVIRELVSPEAKFWTHVEYDVGRAQDVAIQVRGNVSQPGAVVPRRFLEVLSSTGAGPFRRGSGRVDLADAIVKDASSLAGRVIVNRIWGWHFGRPLVQTPSNFGELGARPTHPELLDDLTARFIRGGWSLKGLHREIVLSATYRQSSSYQARHAASDPENALLWRANRQRLDLEAWRDAMLQVSGRMNREIGGPSGDLDDAAMLRRSVYAKVSRKDPSAVQRLFDFPQAIRHSEERAVTTTSLQQLFYLNSGFIEAQAAAANELVYAADSDRGALVRAAFVRVLSREPADNELTRAVEFFGRLDGLDEKDRCAVLVQALLTSNEFLFVD